MGGAKVGRDRIDGGHELALCSSSLAGSSGMPSSSETFPWISMIFSAWARRVARHSFARRSRSTSTRVGSAGFRPRVRARAWSAPASRWRRQSTRWEEYSRSRRSNAPISPGSVQASASRTMASLYSALKRRRLAFSGTSGSGGLGMASGSTLAWGAVIVTVMSWEYSLSPSSVIDRGGVSQLMLAGRGPPLVIEGRPRNYRGRWRPPSSQPQGAGSAVRADVADQNPELVLLRDQRAERRREGTRRTVGPLKRPLRRE